MTSKSICRSLPEVSAVGVSIAPLRRGRQTQGSLQASFSLLARFAIQSCEVMMERIYIGQSQDSLGAGTYRIVRCIVKNTRVGVDGQLT
jgi:hypothetical protein